MRRLALFTVATATTTAMLSPVLTHSPADAAAHKLQRSPFSYTAGAFGTQVRGGQVPAGSDKTAYADISCNDRIGVNKGNHIANVNLKGLGAVHGVESHVWTTRDGSTYAANSEHKIAGITLMQNALGKLEITGLDSRARAWHDPKGFHATTHTKLAGLSLTLPNGKSLNLNLPTVGHPVTVPGVVKLELGSAVRHKHAHDILVRASTLKVTIIPTNTQVRVAQTRAGVSDGIKSGIFGGFGSGLQATVLSPVISTGRVPNQPMPCRGTDGKRVSRSTASVNLPGVATVSGVAAHHWANQTRSKAWGYQQGDVASVSLLGGRVQITGVQGQANVIRTKKGLTRNAGGTRVLGVTLDGKTVKLPDLGKLLTIPGLLSLKQRVIHRIPGGLEVIALQVKLLDGTGATINLGTARLRIHRA